MSVEVQAPSVLRRVELSGRERVNRAFEGRDHDSVPRHDTYWRETIDNWREAGGVATPFEAMTRLGSDMKAVGGSWPSPFPHRKPKVLDEDDETRVVIDQWGQTLREYKHRSGTPEHLDFGLKTREDWENVYKPAYSDYRFGERDFDAVRRNLAFQVRAGNWTFLNGLEAIEGTRRLLGDEMTMISLAEDPDWIQEISQLYTDRVIQGLDEYYEAGVRVDGLWIYGDMAYNHSTMCSPTMYKDVFWPDHKRLVDWAHDRGMKFVFHTDGDVNGVLDLYVEAGVDMLQPLEAKANMDVRKLCPDYGDRLGFFGNIDVMKMGTNDKELIEHEVRSKLEAGKATKRYIYHSDHSVPPQVTWETYSFIIDLLDRYGNYD